MFSGGIERNQWHEIFSDVFKTKASNPGMNIRPHIFESSFSLNLCIENFIGDINAFCLDIGTKLQLSRTACMSVRFPLVELDNAIRFSNVPGLFKGFR